MVPVVLITFILFLAYYAYRRKQIDKVNTQKESDFWQRENDANSTRKQDITNLDYIQIPVEDVYKRQTFTFSAFTTIT